MAQISDILCRIKSDIREEWTGELSAYQGEIVTAQTILKYLNRDELRFREIIETIESLGKRKKILDIGCAYGFYDIGLKKLSEADITGMELKENINAYCRLLSRYDIPVIPADLSVQSPSVSDDSFDIVICSEVLEHLRISPMRAVLEIKRMLKAGGLTLLTTPNIGYLRNIMNLCLGKNIMQVFPDDDSGLTHITDNITHLREYVMEELLDLMRRAGFEIIKSWFVSSAKMNLKPRKTLIPHLLYMALLKARPSFRDYIFVLGRKK